MPLLDHFHPPLHGPRRWEGFHHAWATFIAQQLNRETLPAGYFAESEIKLGPEFEIDVAAMKAGDTWTPPDEVPQREGGSASTAVWSPPRPSVSATVDFSHLEWTEVLVFEDSGGAQLRAAIELVSPANKDRPGTRRTFAAKCAGYIRMGIGVVIVDIVTERKANLHRELFEVLEIKDAADWDPISGLYAVAYRPVPSVKRPRLEAWTKLLRLGKVLPTLPLWLTPAQPIPLDLEASYSTTCESLRISAA